MLLLLAAAAGGHAADAPGRLIVDIVDLSTGRSTPARARLFNHNRSYHRPESRLRVGGKDLDVSYKAGDNREELFYSPPHFEMELPVGAYDLRVEKGFEYYPYEKDFPINYLMAKQAREAGGSVFACHGGAGEFPVDLALGVIDGIEVLQGSKWVRVTDSGRDLLLAPNWYHALNCGFRLAGVAASDYAYLTHKIVNLEGKPTLVAESVVWWLDKIDDLIEWTKRDAIFDRPEDKQQAIEIFNRGKEYYARLLARCRVD